MDVMFSLINSFSSDMQKLSTCKIIQKSISDFNFYNCKQGTSINDAVSIINTYMNASKSRLCGLLLLEKMLKQCSTSVFEENCSTWVRLLSTTMQSYDPPKTMNICHLVFAQLLKYMSQFPELCKEFSTSNLPGIVTGLVTTKCELHETALHFLVQCMRVFSGACGPYRGKIENFLTDLLENENTDIQNVTIVGYTLLPTLGGGGSQGIKYSEGWSQLVRKVITSLTSAYCQLYHCLNNEEDSNIHIGCITLCSVRSEEPYRTCQLVTRYNTLCKLLNSFLRMKFAVTVSVPVREILGTVQKALSVTPKLLMSRPTQERTTLATVLPSIYESSLEVLKTVIQCLSGNLIPYSSSINQCILQVLIITDMPRNYGIESPYRSIRHSAWQTLTSWLHSVGISSGVEAIVDDIIKQAIVDFVPIDDTVKVQTSSSMKLSEVSEHFHGKKKKKGGSSHIGHITTQRKLDENADSVTCIAALNALIVLIKLLAPLLTAQVYNTLLHNIMGTMVKISSNSTNNEIPYGNAECRIKLYKTVLVLVEVSHPAVGVPVQTAVNLFYRGTQDVNEQVSRCCKDALSSIETIIHPSAPTLYFPIENTVDCQYHISSQSIKQNTMLESIVSSDSVPLKIVKNVEESNSAKRYINDTSIDATENVSEGGSENSGLNENLSEQLSTEHENINDSETSTGIKSAAEVNERLPLKEQYSLNNDNFEKDQKTILTKSESLFTVDVTEEHLNKISSEEVNTSKKLLVEVPSTSLDIDDLDEASTSAGKRKWNDDEDDDENKQEQSFKKQETEESSDGSVELMLQSFVDAGPDSE